MLTNLYEGLVDREYDGAITNAQQVIIEMKNLIKSIADDDF
jgi:hypothetical protein